MPAKRATVIKSTEYPLTNALALQMGLEVQVRRYDSNYSTRNQQIKPYEDRNLCGDYVSKEDWSEVKKRPKWTLVEVKRSGANEWSALCVFDDVGFPNVRKDARKRPEQYLDAENNPVPIDDRTHAEIVIWCGLKDGSQSASIALYVTMELISHTGKRVFLIQGVNDNGQPSPSALNAYNRLGFRTLHTARLGLYANGAIPKDRGAVTIAELQRWLTSFRNRDQAAPALPPLPPGIVRAVSRSPVPRQASPVQVVPRQASPVQVVPRQASPVQVVPRQASPVPPQQVEVPEIRIEPDDLFRPEDVEALEANFNQGGLLINAPDALPQVVIPTRFDGRMATVNGVQIEVSMNRAFWWMDPQSTELKCSQLYKVVDADGCYVVLPHAQPVENAPEVEPLLEFACVFYDAAATPQVIVDPQGNVRVEAPANANPKIRLANGQYLSYDDPEPLISRWGYAYQQMTDSQNRIHLVLVRHNATVQPGANASIMLRGEVVQESVVGRSIRYPLMDTMQLLNYPAARIYMYCQLFQITIANSYNFRNQTCTFDQSGQPYVIDRENIVLYGSSKLLVVKQDRVSMNSTMILLPHNMWYQEERPAAEDMARDEMLDSRRQARRENQDQPERKRFETRKYPPLQMDKQVLDGMVEFALEMDAHGNAYLMDGSLWRLTSRYTLSRPSSFLAREVIRGGGAETRWIHAGLYSPPSTMPHYVLNRYSQAIVPLPPQPVQGATGAGRKPRAIPQGRLYCSTSTDPNAQDPWRVVMDDTGRKQIVYDASGVKLWRFLEDGTVVAGGNLPSQPLRRTGSRYECYVDGISAARGDDSWRRHEIRDPL